VVNLNQVNILIYNLLILVEAFLSNHPNHQEAFLAIPHQQVDPVSLPTHLSLPGDFLVILSHQEPFLAPQALHKPQEVSSTILLHHLQEDSLLTINHLEAF